MVSLPDKFESETSAIEESCDLTILRIGELISKSQVQERRVVEDAFRARHKFKNQKKGRKVFSNKFGEVKSGGNQGDSSIKGKFPPCGICKKTNHLEKNC